jgi:hypothetical protein
MEYRRRSLSSSLDEDSDMERQPSRRRTTSSSIEEDLDHYADYVYNGTFSVARFFYNGAINLIKDCFRR